MKRRIWWLLLLPLAGCASQQEQTMRRLNDIAEQLLARECDQPQLSYRQVENPHVPGLIDEVEILRCPGLVAQIYLSEAASNPNGMPILLEVSEPQPGLPSFMNVGADRAGLVAELGRPARQGPELLRYQSRETTENVTFRLRGERIASIRWEWYFD
ncbi:hypothetical protein [Zobellella iuensis]|uniref:Lipoprotein n=1 Tax=Zobellella iuensis TaxID=2803811 RepID=A0ABS1QQL1_9GAMM|nr:hypothetical protein [Zobellella iuensis]MBL1377158.1 hypothetical protein [Zobellella iuensis]